MPVMSYRRLSLGERLAEEAFDGLLEELRQKIEDPNTDRNELCKRTLADFYFGPLASQMLATTGASHAAQALVSSFDPRNITMEPEYYEDLDPEKYYPRKPLIWLWV